MQEYLPEPVTGGSAEQTIGVHAGMRRESCGPISIYPKPGAMKAGAGLRPKSQHFSS